MGGCPETGDYTGHLRYSPLKAVVDHLVVGERPADLELGLGNAEPALDVFLGVAPTAQSLFEDLLGGRDHQDHAGRGILLLDLGGAVDLDLEHQISARGDVLPRRAVPLVVAREV